MVQKGFKINKDIILGKGQYQVYLATKRGRKYAAKFLSDKNVDELKENELFLFNHGQGHPNILQVENYCEAYIGSWVFTEFCEYGSLTKYSETHTSDFHKNETKHNIMKQVTLGLQFLHSQNKIHRDIKPGNILVTTDEKKRIIVKLSDFGESRNMDRTAIATVIGTPFFAPPEMFEGIEKKTRQNRKVDIFSMGLTFLGIIQNNQKLIPIGEGLKQSDFIGLKMLQEPTYKPVTIKDNDDSFIQTVKEIVLETVIKDPYKRLPAEGILHKLEVKIDFNM